MFGFKSKKVAFGEHKEQQPPKHQPFRWRSRLFAGIIMLLLGFIGLIVTRVYPDTSWIYWSVLSFVYAIICIWLSLFLSRWKTNEHHTIWRETLHWNATLATVYILILQVNHGVIGNFEGGITIMIALALATFLAGIYIDGTFMLVGFVIGLFTLVITLIQSFFIVIAIIIVVIAIILSVLIARYKRDRFK